MPGVTFIISYGNASNGLNCIEYAPETVSQLKCSEKLTSDGDQHKKGREMCQIHAKFTYWIFVIERQEHITAKSWRTVFISRDSTRKRFTVTIRCTCRNVGSKRKSTKQRNSLMESGLLEDIVARIPEPLYLFVPFRDKKSRSKLKVFN